MNSQTDTLTAYAMIQKNMQRSTLMQNNINSNKCVNTTELIHVYKFEKVKIIVRTINKNTNPEAVLHRLKQIAVNFTDTEN